MEATSLFSPDVLSTLTPSADEAHAEQQQIAIATLRERLGLTGPLTYTVVSIPLDQLVVPRVTPQARIAAQALAHNIALYGLKDAPAVLALPAETPATPATADDPDDLDDGAALFTPRYEVVDGRRRILALRWLREQGSPEWEFVPCHAYTIPDEVAARRWRAMTTLVGNLARSSMWIEELRALVQLLDDHPHLTDRQLWTALGMKPAQFRKLVRLARLPRPILDQVFAGQVTNQALLQRIAAKLSGDQQREVAQRATVGEAITATLVDAVWRRHLARISAQPLFRQAIAATAVRPSAHASTHASTPQSGRRDGASGPAAPNAPLSGTPRAEESTSAAPAGLVDRCERDECDERDGFGDGLQRKVTARSATRQGGQDGQDGDLRLTRDELTKVCQTLAALHPRLLADPRLGQAALIAQALVYELAPVCDALTQPVGHNSFDSFGTTDPI